MGLVISEPPAKKPRLGEIYKVDEEIRPHDDGRRPPQTEKDPILQINKIPTLGYAARLRQPQPRPEPPAHCVAPKNDPVFDAMSLYEQEQYFNKMRKAKLEQDLLERAANFANEDSEDSEESEDFSEEEESKETEPRDIVCGVCTKKNLHITIRCPYLVRIPNVKEATLDPSYVLVCKCCFKVGGHCDETDRVWFARAVHASRVY